MEFEKEERELGRLIKDKGTEKERIIRAEVVVLKTERVREGTSEKKKHREVREIAKTVDWANRK